MDSKKSKDKSKSNIKGQIYPFIPTRDVIILEGLTDYIEVGRERSKKSVEISQKAFGMQMVLIPQKNAEQKEISSINDLHKYGVLVEIIRVDNLGNNQRITLKSIQKVEIVTFEEEEKKDDAYIASFKFVKTSSVIKKTEKFEKNWTQLYDAISHKFFAKNEQFKKIFLKNSLPNFSKEDLLNLHNLNLVISSFAIPMKFIYIFFNQKTINGKIDVLWTIIDELVEGLEATKEVDHEIETELKKSLDKQNKEFLLRERLKVTRNLLGEDSVEDDKIEKILDDKQLSKIYPEEVKLAIKKEKAKLKSMMSSSPDANITRNYIDLLTQLPWRRTSIEELNIKKVKKILNEQHYGLKDVKERIIEFVAVMINNQKVHPDKYKNNRLTDMPNTEINENLFVKEYGQNKVQENNSRLLFLLH